jgi:hypothetical protein
MSGRYYDDEPSVMPSELGESVLEDASSIGDMTKFTKFTYQDVAKRKDIDLLETCNPNAGAQSRISLEESNVSSPRGDPLDQGSSAGKATADAGEVDIDASVGPSLMGTATVGERGADFSLIQSEMGTATEVVGERGADASLIESEMETVVGERGADVSLLMSEADTIEKSVAERAMETTNESEISAKNPIRATFASLWHKKKKDTPSKKFLRRNSSRQTSAAVEAEMIVPDTNVAGVAEQYQASEVGSDRGHPYVNVSDDMTVISALSIGGVSTIPASPARPTASKDANLMPAVDDAEDRQEDAIVEVDGEESSDEGPKNADQANVKEEQSKTEVEQLEAAAKRSESEQIPRQSLYPDSSDSEAEPSRQSLYPDSSDSEAENEEESDAESNLEVKPIIENEGDGSTVAYAHITPMEEENETDADDAEGILERTADDDSDAPTVYEEERDAPNKSIEEPSSDEQDESQQAPGPAPELTSREATSPTSEEATEATVAYADAPEEEPKSQQHHFEIDAVIKDAIESKPSGESSEDELDGEISAAVEECSNLSESDEDDGESISSSSASSLIQEIVPNASPKRSPKRKSDGGA